MVKAGDIVKVKVMEVDVQRKRIALSMRLNDEPGQDNRSQRSAAPRRNDQQRRQPRRDDASSNNAVGNNAMGGALRRLLPRRKVNSAKTKKTLQSGSSAGAFLFE